MNNQAKAQLFDLYPQDREALTRIRERLELNSNALAVRVAIRELAKRLIKSPMVTTSLVLGGKEAPFPPETKTIEGIDKDGVMP